jgi:hypothetical protein
MKAPLLLGTDVTNMTAETLATLTNRDIIGVNQDPLGVQARLLPTNGTTTTLFDSGAAAASGGEEDEDAVGGSVEATEWVWAVSPTKQPPDTGWVMGADGTVKHGGADGLCLTAQATLAPLSLEPCASPAGVMQRWVLEPGGNLRLQGGSKKCLALWGGGGPGVVVYECNSGANEDFVLSQGTLCSKTKQPQPQPQLQRGQGQGVGAARAEAAGAARCLTTNSTKPGKGGGGGGGGGGHHHPPHPPQEAGPVLTWVGELAGGAHVALLVNNQIEAVTLRFNSSDLDLDDSGSGSGSCYAVRELWANKTLPQRVCAGSSTVLSFPSVGAHDCIMLRFSPRA